MRNAPLVLHRAAAGSVRSSPAPQPPGRRVAAVVSAAVVLPRGHGNTPRRPPPGLWPPRDRARSLVPPTIHMPDRMWTLRPGPGRGCCGAAIPRPCARSTEPSAGRHSRRIDVIPWGARAHASAADVSNVIPSAAERRVFRTIRHRALVATAHGECSIRFGSSAAHGLRCGGRSRLRDTFW